MEAAATDRETRFHLRREQMARDRAHAQRRRATMQRVAWALGAAATVLLVAVMAGERGALVGVVVVVLALVASAVGARLAPRRGASAWDWQAQRYRLHGRPADRVQALDRPDGPRDHL